MTDITQLTVLPTFSSNPDGSLFQLYDKNNNPTGLYCSGDNKSQGRYCNNGKELRQIIDFTDDPNNCKYHSASAIAQQQFATNQIIQNNIQYVSNIVITQVSNTIGIDPSQLNTVLQQVGSIYNLISTNDQTDMSQTAQILSLQNEIVILKTIIKNLNMQSLTDLSFKSALI